MVAATWFIAFAGYRVAWPIFLLWVYQLQENLPKHWEQWLTRQDWMLEFAIVGSIVWIVLMMAREAPGIRDTYQHHFRPKIAFQLKEIAGVNTSMITVGKVRTVDGVVMVLLGHFANEGGVPSTVISVETSLVKRWFFQKLPISQQATTVAFRESGSNELVGERGYYVGPFMISPEIDITTIVSFGRWVNCKKLNNSYQVRIRWRAFGQGIKETLTTPDWEVVKRLAEDRLGRPPIPLTMSLEEENP